MLHTSQLNSRRRGIVLLVVMALLSLFAAVGIGFVIYAESAATSAKYNREAYAPTQPDVDPELILNYFLSQFIYDTDNLYSSIRGHSLGRSLYGLNYDGAALGQNETPFDGTGRLGYQHTFGNIAGLADRDLINYMYFPLDGFLRDPERLGTRLTPTDPKGAYVRTANPPYTFPDNNNVFLAMINAEGEVLAPSYHRPFLFGPDDATNPNWTNATGKYLALTPRQQEHSTEFPLPLPGGHVKNLDASPGTRKAGGGYANNDSYWLDIGFPVLVAKDGRKFKPLVAVLVLDLDGKVNVNAAGNIRGVDATGQPAHMSNRGYVPSEINISRVIKKSDWTKIFTDPSQGRYGSDQKPATAGATVLSTPVSGRPWIYAETPPFYSQIDIDGVDAATSTSTAKMLMPGDAGTFPYVGFPTYSSGYGNADTAERTNHPVLYNPIYPKYTAEGSAGAADDSRIAASELEAPLRYAGTGSPALLSILFGMSPQSFNDPADLLSSKHARRSITTDSFDFGQPGSAPWLNGPSTYEIAAGATAEKRFPVGTASNPYSTFIGPGGAVLATPALKSEFQPDLGGAARAIQTNSPLIQRLVINRPLAAYPAPDADGRISDKSGFTAAQTARQKLAGELFYLLRYVTTGQDPSVVIPDPMSAKEEETLGWLAQLAVNIVDYRDSDDFMTPFQWNTIAGKWVFGTELPKLVINEAYSEVMNNKDDLTAMTAAKDFEVNFWVELLNAMKNDANRDMTVRLQMKQSTAGDAAYAIYKLVIAEVPSGPMFADETTGEPIGMDIALEVSKYEADPMFPAAAGVDTDLVLPVDTAYKGASTENKGFYVIGPVADFPSGPAPDPALPQATLRVKEQMIGGKTNAMMHKIPNTTNLSNLEKHNVFLRRLACPLLPPNTDVTSALYNPYITVDYIEKLKSWDGVKVGPGGAHTPPAIETRNSVGRRQPYAAHPSWQVDQTPDKDATAAGIDKYKDQPQHTFFRHNAVEDTAPPDMTLAEQTLKQFDWLVHLDRSLVSPIELLHVSCFKPYELTQYFMINISPPKKFNHQAPWLANGGNDTRLYRLLEYVDAGHRSAGVTLDGRIPGKININTGFYESFSALCDAQLASEFQEAHVQAIFGNMRRLNADGTLNKDFKPFTSLATGYFSSDATSPFPGGAGIDDTLLRRADPTADANLRLFEPQPVKDHPWLRYEVLNKIFNNTTTRSNVFAVWITVGLFEVKDENARPVKLGEEIGFKQNRHIRHRMFAIVDRSQMRIRLIDSSTKNEALLYTSGAVTVNPGDQQTYVIAGPLGRTDLKFDTINGRKWEINVGTMLTLNPGGTNEETVRVHTVDLAKNPVEYHVRATQSHQANEPIISRGNLGPWTDVRYDMRNDTEVVRYFSVIK